MHEAGLAFGRLICTRNGGACAKAHYPRPLEFKLEILEYGLAMPRDEDAIAETKALLEHVRGLAMTDRR
jgi:hypothetical protein